MKGKREGEKENRSERGGREAGKVTEETERERYILSSSSLNKLCLLYIFQ